MLLFECEYEQPEFSVANQSYVLSCGTRYYAVLKEQSHRYFLNFFITNLLNSYRSNLLINCFQTTKGTISNESGKKKLTKSVRLYLFFLRHKSANLKKSVKSFQVGGHFHPGHSQPATIIVSVRAI